MMKKFLAVFLVICFVCCVMVHGQNKRFSFEVMLNNITNFQDIPSWNAIASFWTEDSYCPIDGYDLIWIDIYGTPSIAPDNPNYIVGGEYRGSYPVAYDTNGVYVDDDKIVPMWMVRYDANGLTVANPYDRQGHGIDEWPVILYYDFPYESYEGDSEVLEFFDSVRGFFGRLKLTFSTIGDMITGIFNNIPYLMPWNSTVEVTS